ncbi:hypothetical protein GCM10018793_58410 [Streptomyces sulfonofaciens]|uniref:Uncharacterized protein n=1 Tax=Streptomyces sulfonofaciens TaxID=68272 RepID=A0A919L688_9ACTN|nr:hypothetical protein GCM10018793_58410 [Streptomyces sulfonofaciens]
MKGREQRTRRGGRPGARGGRALRVRGDEDRGNGLRPAVDEKSENDETLRIMD